MKIEKIHWHYFLLILAIILASYGIYFYISTDNDVYTSFIFLAFYLGMYALLYISFSQSFKKRGLDLDKETKGKIVYSLKKLVLNYLIFLIVTFSSIVLIALISNFSLFINDIEAYLYFVVSYFLIVHFMFIPTVKYARQVKFKKSSAYIIWLASALLAISLALKILSGSV